jgi:hypothetical protein
MAAWYQWRLPLRGSRRVAQGRWHVGFDGFGGLVTD